MPTHPSIDPPSRPIIPTIRAEPRPLCICCGSSGFLLYEDLPDNLFSAPGLWTLRKCQKTACGLLWLDPMPLTADLDVAYSNYYTHGAEIKRSATFSTAKIIYRMVVDCLLMIGAIPMERRRAALMFLGDLRPGRLLDVGCGEGGFLGTMAQRGWSVMGVDFDPDAVAAARKKHTIDVQVGTVDTVIEMGATFDVVTASHVIEHVPDPLEFLIKCRKLVRPGGLMILRTPNVNSFGHRRYGRFWRGLEPPRHLHLLSVPALEGLAQRAGFSRVSCFTTSVAAEHMLMVSHILESKGCYPPKTATILENVYYKLLAPVMGLRGKLAWQLNRGSGEEICARLTNAPVDE